MASTTATLHSESRESVSMAVVHAVADEKDVSPVDVDPLYEVVDPDALNRFVGSLSSTPPEDPGCVSFPYAGCDVTVFADETVSVSTRD
ncbi:hypothetical protein G9C85_00065 [Halorubellus sp. JP-L1]|uniref:HalOD1 output domain-containing protein n=1 Tax=Halorubellus sp. JP-L1 TaxID=2715753 RepID=UPI00140C7731|nr:HalOD1 output domain-containing protein [Halorubellus sp. JP-L1]NHN40034.1 hypothetical protein [Halorubellus sp. JP-L1]